jgi:PadR family transcriptional regulator PadR
MVGNQAHETELVLRALLDAPRRGAYWSEIVRASGLGPSRAYAVMRRLESEGCIDGTWGEIDPSSERRPPRRRYRLTDEGYRVALDAMDEEQDAPRADAMPAAGSLDPDRDFGVVLLYGRPLAEQARLRALLRARFPRRQVGPVEDRQAFDVLSADWPPFDLHSVELSDQ